MAISSEPRLGASTNGDLVNRVQQLRLDGQLGAGKNSRGGGGALLPWVLCGLLAVTWAGVGVRSYKNAGQKADDTASAPQGTAPAASSTNTPQPAGPSAVAEGELVTQLKGNVIPSLQITVSPRDVAAEITEIFFAEGKRVKRGDKIATLLDHLYVNRLNTEVASVAAAEAQVTRAQASQTSVAAKVAKAKSALAAAEARGTRATAMQERAGKDFDQARQQRASGSIALLDYQRFDADKQAADADKIAATADIEAAKREVEAAEAEVKTAVASTKAATADLGAAKARCAEAQRLVENCVVTAPIDGTILTKSADKGALVSPNSFNVAAGICLIADLSKLEVEIDVPERQITRLKSGQSCKLQADADPTREYRGVVDRVMPIADDTKNVVKVRIRAYLKKGEQQGEFLKPKMSITATVYNTPFTFDPSKDLPWGDEATRK
ncbi:Secretion protein HlyD family protein OS=Pirellula staleyi (strain ATCC 27377 / DSM 6068 / ICPB 4128) GN=Psta_2961 PE=4 SV=1: HlyD_2 [Gemmata massiliana]|uniref:CusB-like beta-barrel domain-containing protein n=1 Tax=Gemmata massiliana TaxID=1210884 RepID=A0A6P2CRW1_9BACT|nr:efflux RND transporter periplasmic adaptor subunit [Gemmata massiliana]VTR90815.1 Secretion protein HlyD family protein OS=Pirellula staleyi (strain ATCC 27377 / DSM 6068 / ICPB 4128) GN=Psta_2961 PE=4 SV=1: HlyD_2 [Gemmata massiliana]